MKRFRSSSLRWGDSMIFTLDEKTGKIVIYDQNDDIPIEATRKGWVGLRYYMDFFGCFEEDDIMIEEI